MWKIEHSVKGYRAMLDGQSITFDDWLGNEVEYFATEADCQHAIRTGHAWFLNP